MDAQQPGDAPSEAARVGNEQEGIRGTASQQQQQQPQAVRPTLSEPPHKRSKTQESQKTSTISTKEAAPSKSAASLPSSTPSGPQAESSNGNGSGVGAHNGTEGKRPKKVSTGDKSIASSTLTSSPSSPKSSISSTGSTPKKKKKKVTSKQKRDTPQKPQGKGIKKPATRKGTPERKTKTKKKRTPKPQTDPTARAKDMENPSPSKSTTSIRETKSSSSSSPFADPQSRSSTSTKPHRQLDSQETKPAQPQLSASTDGQATDAREAQSAASASDQLPVTCPAHPSVQPSNAAEMSSGSSVSNPSSNLAAEPATGPDPAQASSLSPESGVGSSSSRASTRSRPEEGGQEQCFRFITLNTRKVQCGKLEKYYHDTVELKPRHKDTEKDPCQNCLRFAFLKTALRSGVEEFAVSNSKREDILELYNHMKDAQLTPEAVFCLLQLSADEHGSRVIKNSKSSQVEKWMSSLGSTEFLLVLEPCGVLFRAPDVEVDEEMDNDEEEDEREMQRLPIPAQEPKFNAICEKYAQGQHATYGGFGKLARNDDRLVESLPAVTRSNIGDDTPPFFPLQHFVGKHIADTIWKKYLKSNGARQLFEGLGGILIIVPNFNSLFLQTNSRAVTFFKHNSISKDMMTIVKCHKGDRDRVEHFWKRVVVEERKLFVVVHDEAHWAIDKSPDRHSNRGLVDLFLNRPHLAQKPQREARNVIRLLVTATPYALQSQSSRISKDHEFRWDDMEEAFLSKEDTSRNGNPNCLQYYGLFHLRQAVQGTQVEENPRLVRDAAFATLVEKDIGRRCVRARERLITTFLVCYKASLMLALHELGAIKLQLDEQSELQRRTTNPTRNVTTSFLRATTSDKRKAGGVEAFNTKPISTWSTGRNTPPIGAGHMLLIRVVDNAMGNTLVEELRIFRGKMGLSERFAILQDTSKKPLCRSLCDDNEMSSCLLRLKRLRGTSDVKSYEHLEGLPCVLILCGKGRMGDTFPKSLRYYDLRLRYGSESSRAYMEQDLGRMFRYANDLSELPQCLLPPKAFDALKNKRLTEMSPDARLTFKKGHKDVEPGDESSQHSDFYRANTEPTHKHYDYDRDGAMDANRFLLHGKPQVGKTGAYLWALKHLAIRAREQSGEDIVCCDDDEESGGEYPTDTDAESQEDAQLKRGVFPDPEQIRMLRVRKPGKGKYGLPTDKDDENNLASDHRSRVRNTGAQIRIDDKTRQRIRRHYPTGPFDLKPRQQGQEQIMPPKPCNDGSKWHIPEDKKYLFNKKPFRIKIERLELPLIFMPSSGRAACGLLDLSDTMQDDGEETLTWLQIIVVKQHEFDEYRKHHSAVVVCALPPEASKRGIGASRDFIKSFATKNWKKSKKACGQQEKGHMKEKTQDRNEQEETNRKKRLIRAKRAREFILMLDDSCLKFTKALLKKDPCAFTPGSDKAQGTKPQQRDTSAPTTAADLDKEHVWQWDWENRTQRPKYFMKDVRLRDVLQHMLSDSRLSEYALVGVARWRPELVNTFNPYQRSHVYSFLLLNVEKTKRVQYDQKDIVAEDIRFNNRLKRRGLLFVKYNRFILMKKQFKTGGCSELVLDTQEAHKTFLGQELFTLNFKLCELPNLKDSPMLFEVPGVPKARVKAAMQGDVQPLLKYLSRNDKLQPSYQVQGFDSLHINHILQGDQVGVFCRVCMRPKDKSLVFKRLDYWRNRVQGRDVESVALLDALRFLQDEAVLPSAQKQPFKVKIDTSGLSKRKPVVQAPFESHRSQNDADVLVGFSEQAAWVNVQHLSKDSWASSSRYCAMLDFVNYCKSGENEEEEDPCDHLASLLNRRPAGSVFFYPYLGWLIFLPSTGQQQQQQHMTRQDEHPKIRGAEKQPGNENVSRNDEQEEEEQEEEEDDDDDDEYESSVDEHDYFC